jgi:hypothetical protein
MDAPDSKSEASPASASETAGPKTFAEFLESYGPDVTHAVPDLISKNQNGHEILAQPEIVLHCPTCEGERRFETSESLYVQNRPANVFVTYWCKNCEKYTKVFSLVFKKTSNRSGHVQKYGENPPFGPPTPARVMKLVGEDRELFLKGRRAELRGLGIGAFAYYRRVVEEQKSRIIAEIGKVAVKLSPSKETEALFAKAAAETQFSTAIDLVKAAIPESLKIDGHNPLSLLHDALSEGLHAQTDEVCLDLAMSIRVLLIELAERTSTALKEEAVLKEAVSKVLNRKSK